MYHPCHAPSSNRRPRWLPRASASNVPLRFAPFTPTFALPMTFAARSILLLGSAAALLAPEVLARRWNATGHQVVAIIAWNHLTPQARARATQLLRNGPPVAHLRDNEPSTGTDDEKAKALFVATSVWADQIKGRNAPNHEYDHGVWHYTDYFWKQVDGKAVATPEFGPDKENALERLGVMQELLASNAADTTKSVALAWIEHLVGDVHQPLHLSARVTTESPTGDKGGNDVKLGGNPNNLHAYWDGILDVTDPPPQGDRSAYYEAWAARLEQKLPMASFSKAELEAGADVWGKESLALAQEKLYPAEIVTGAVPSDAYKAQSGAVGERRIALAGYRLAAVLNRLLK